MTRPHRFLLYTALSTLVLGACHDTASEPASEPPDEATAAQGRATDSDGSEIFSPEVVRADLDALYAGLREAHYDLYAQTSEAAFDAHHAALRASITAPLDRTATEVLFQRLASFADIGHARVDFPAAAYAAFREAGGKAAPFFIRVIEGRTLVTESYDSDLRVGDEITAIDEVPIATWLDRVGAHVSADTPYLEHSLLEFWFPRLLWLELGEIDTLRIGVHRADEAAETVLVEGRTAAEIGDASGSGPVRLELSWNERESRMLEEKVAYLRPGPFYDPTGADAYNPTAFQAFLDDVFTEWVAADTPALIIDLRDNPGGDNSFSDPMIAWFADRPFRFYSRFGIRVSPQTTASNAQRLEASEVAGISHTYAELFAEQPNGAIVDFEMPVAEPRDGVRFTGKVYVLINRHSFSNAVNVAALVQDYGFATVLGEETADLATTYGAMEHFDLPATGIRVGYPKAFIIRPNGDETLRGVVPDIAIETPLVQGPDDPVLQRAVEIVRREIDSAD